MECWKAYVQSILGVVVEDAEAKFDALAESEKTAWLAVQDVVQDVQAVGKK